MRNPDGKDPMVPWIVVHYVDLMFPLWKDDALFLHSDLWVGQHEYGGRWRFTVELKRRGKRRTFSGWRDSRFQAMRAAEQRAREWEARFFS
ncbi:MAG: hypothetical protein WC683_09395 [bacterium]